jgi:hypothetical protein
MNDSFMAISCSNSSEMDLAVTGVLFSGEHVE